MNILLIGIFLFCSFHVSSKAPVLSDKELSKRPGRVIRTCCAFGSDLRYAVIPFVRRTDIISTQELGTHNYLGGKKEKNGIIYTYKGGFIDIGHLRDYADWTAYLYSQIHRNKEDLENITLKLGIEGGPKTLSFNIPEIQDDVDFVQLAGSIAYDLSLWHEIATYFGVSLIPLIPERFSSFSPEDVYSNLLGAIIGIKAINSELEYNDAVTSILASTLADLNAVSTNDATYKAMNSVESIWWTSKKALPNKHFLLKRNLDTDLFLQPWLVPGEKNEHFGQRLYKPHSKYSDYYTLKIKPNAKFPLNSILSETTDQGISQKDFKSFINYIRKTDEKLENGMTDKQIKREIRANKQKVKRNANIGSSKNIVPEVYEYHLSKTFSQDPDVLFKAFMDDHILKEIWGLNDLKMDVRPNGESKAILWIEEENWNFTMTYIDVIPNEKLSWTVIFDSFPDKVVKTIVTFKKSEFGTKLTFQQKNFTDDNENEKNMKANIQALNTLETLLKK